jgi:hypothetical protein
MLGSGELSINQARSGRGWRALDMWIAIVS